MRTLISFLIFLAIKLITVLFYRFEVKWISELKSWEKIRLIVLLNHTSLYEPLYIGQLPLSFVWRLSRKLVAPGANKTLDRPLVGFFWKLLNPGIKSITRKRDKSWREFMKNLEPRSIITIAAEGRMKRPNGLDVSGRPMTVRSGVADILETLNEGRVLMAYSGGLHHVQKPGEHFPKIFKTLKMNFELIDIEDYKAGFNSEGIQWKRDVVADLQDRLIKNCPKADDTPTHI